MLDVMQLDVEDVKRILAGLIVLFFFPEKVLKSFVFLLLLLFDDKGIVKKND